jgi:prolyl-tRNA synthetase
MRLSALLGRTLRQPPSDAHLVSHQLLVRAAYVRPVEDGFFAYLPLGRLALLRQHHLVRRTLTAPGGQEVYVPNLPGAKPAQTLVRLVRREVDSYRQLPLRLFELAHRSLPEFQARTGLFGASERPFAEIHTFGDAGSLEEDPQIAEALERILAVCQVPAVWADAGNGSQRAYYVHPSGDDDLVRCPSCGYAAERSWATMSWLEPPVGTELAPEEIETPGCDTIAALAQFLDIPAAQTLKMVFYSVEGRVTCVVIRGDRQVDEAKLARVLGTDWYYSSLEDELAEVGAVGGYASPIGLDANRVRVVADPSVRSGKNFVSGANRPDYHIQNVNTPRDFAPREWADLALVTPGDPCPHCDAYLEIEPAFALAGRTTPVPCDPAAEYLDAQGRAHPLWMARWTLDLGRLLAATVEEHHDSHGIIWPVASAPFDVHLVALDVRKEAAARQAAALYDRLRAGGFSVLYDDRGASAGVKFNDADLIGVPLRLTVSKRSAEEGRIEAKWRYNTERLRLDDEELEAELTRLRQP